MVCVVQTVEELCLDGVEVCEVVEKLQLYILQGSYW